MLNIDVMASAPEPQNVNAFDFATLWNADEPALIVAPWTSVSKLNIAGVPQAPPDAPPSVAATLQLPPPVPAVPVGAPPVPPGALPPVPAPPAVPLWPPRPAVPGLPPAPGAAVGRVHAAVGAAGRAEGGEQEDRGGGPHQVSPEIIDEIRRR